MRRMHSIAALAGVLALAFVASASGQVVTDQERQLDTQAATMDSLSGSTSGGTQAAVSIETLFNVTAAQVSALRADKLGYGEIVILLSLAQQMPGGLTADNIASVLATRQGPPVMGWGAVARSLKLKLGDVLSDVNRAVGKEQEDVDNEHTASGKGKSEGRSDDGSSEHEGGSHAGAPAGASGSEGRDKS